jgi:hypothetical protein
MPTCVQLFLQCYPTGVAGVLHKPSSHYWKAMAIKLCDEQHKLPGEVMAFMKGCSVHSRSLLEMKLGGIIKLDCHFLANEELHLQFSILSLPEDSKLKQISKILVTRALLLLLLVMQQAERHGSHDECSIIEHVVLDLLNHMALLQSWSIFMDSQFPLNT